MIFVDGCLYMVSVIVVFKDCIFIDLMVYIFNVFIFNGDGLNDMFEIVIIEFYLNEGYIFNCWGNIVCELIDDVNYWNGKDKNVGNDLLDGVYIYIVIIIGQDNKKKQYQGFVILFR